MVDLRVLEEAGLLPVKEHSPVFGEASLNKFMGLGRPVWKATRAALTQLLSKDDATLRDNAELRTKAVLKLDQVALLMPAKVGDYTDFYSSKEHATNLGKMFRPDEEALKPNWYVVVSFSSGVGSGSDCVGCGCLLVIMEERAPLSLAELLFVAHGAKRSLPPLLLPLLRSAPA